MADGNLYNRKGFDRKILFEGLSRGEISPTDMDGLYEYGGSHLILIEVKQNDAPITKGQKPVLQNIVINWVKAGLFDEFVKDTEDGERKNKLPFQLGNEHKRKNAVAIKVSFEESKHLNDKGDILLRKCMVTEEYTTYFEGRDVKGRWESFPVGTQKTVEEYVDGKVNDWNMGRMSNKDEK